MSVLPKIDAFASDLTAIRQDLHAHPELGFEETRTAGIVAEQLRAYGVDEVHEGLGGTGVVAVIRGQGGGNRRIGLRADMDALPILEASGVDYASTNPGKMHACGHDGHTTMLLGAARYLAATRDFDGTAVLIFQPAEELLLSFHRPAANEHLAHALAEGRDVRVDPVHGGEYPGLPPGPRVHGFGKYLFHGFGVGVVVRECVVERIVAIDHLDPDAFEDLGRKSGGGAVAGGADDLQLAGHFEIPHEVVDIGVPDTVDEFIGPAWARFALAFKHDVLQLAHLVGAVGQRAFKAHLHAGPAIRVMRCCDHGDGRHIQVELCKIGHGRQRGADVFYLDARLH